MSLFIVSDCVSSRWSESGGGGGGLQDWMHNGAGSEFISL